MNRMKREKRTGNLKIFSDLLQQSTELLKSTKNCLKLFGKSDAEGDREGCTEYKIFNVSKQSEKMYN